MDCAHCHTHCEPPVRNREGIPFCCRGCQTVYDYISSHDLKNYYSLKEQSDTKLEPVSIEKSDFAYMDGVDFVSSFQRIDKHQTPYLEFYLEGVHCLACLWLIEKLPEYTEGIQRVQLDMSKSIAKVYLAEGGTYSRAAVALNSLGYKPHPIMEDKEREDFKLKEERKDLLKIGVAGAFFGNIMLISVSMYAGVQGFWLESFRWMTFVLALPVLLYSAMPFYKNAFAPLKKKVLTIDFPIAIALIIGTITGFIHLITKTGELYFDSLTALVFLLLMARYLLKKAQQSGLSPESLSAFYQTQSVYRQINSGDQYEAIHPKFISTNDIIKVPIGAYFPADGELISEQTYSDHALLTGESFPIALIKGQKVFQGTKNLGQIALIKVNNVGDETKLGKIILDVKKGWQQKPILIQKTDQLAKYFVATVSLLAISLFSYFALIGEAAIGVQRALALIIVTCPCALGLAAPLALLNTLKKASLKGIFIKNENVLEKLTQCKNIFLDKTGTLTQGHFTVANWNEIKTAKLRLADIVYSLESYSQHPIANSLKEYIEQYQSSFQKHSVRTFKELPGIGIEGSIAGNLYSLKRLNTDQERFTTIAVYENANQIATIEMEDRLREDAILTIASLKKLIPNISILSGDHQGIVRRIAKLLNIDQDHSHGELSPEQKLEIIKKTPYSIMVGDGANDAPSLSHAHIGVAVKGSVDISLRAADIYLTKPGVQSINHLIKVSFETMKVINRNFIFSIVYNLLGAGLAISGLITPLAAAILMPLSSFTVLVSSFLGTKKMRKIL